MIVGGRRGGRMSRGFLGGGTRGGHTMVRGRRGCGGIRWEWLGWRRMCKDFLMKKGHHVRLYALVLRNC
jgi:hypothetical protein